VYVLNVSASFNALSLTIEYTEVDRKHEARNCWLCFTCFNVGTWKNV